MRCTTLALSTALVLAAVPLQAQVPDTAAIVDEVRRQLQTGELTPDEVRARIRAAGLSEEEVRDQLEAAGYPASLLDAYLSGGMPGRTGFDMSRTEVESILRRLSIPPLDSLAMDSLMRVKADSLRADSMRRQLLAVDTLAAERGPPIFGKQLFDAVTTQFQPVTMGPVPANYRLGPGDQLVLILTGDVQEIHELPVTREGFVVIPNVGRVSVNGLTLEQFREALYTYLGRAYSGIGKGPEATTHFEVSISQLRRNQVFVVGEVERPGAYELSSVSTALEAMYMAGGPSEQGSFRNIQVRRGDRLVANLDIYEYLTGGTARGDIPLNQGDVVFVPVRSRRVQIDGNVVRPGIYELKGEEGLRALMELAGGVEPEADLRRVQIDRVLPPEERRPGVHRTLFDVDVADLMDEEGELVPLQAGDRIYVFAVAEERRNTVTIRGNVWSPGMYELTSGLTVGALVERAGGLKDDSYVGRAQVLRLDPEDQTRRVIPVSLRGDGNVELREYDDVVVYSVGALREDRFVTIDGAVQSPGTYEYHDDMTLRDLVLMAGGLKDEASVEQAEVARLSERPDAPGDLTDVMEVPLDSSYFVSADEPAPGGGSDGSNGGGAGNAAPDFTLERYDRVFIRRRPGWEPARTVQITGEVRYPGGYSLKRKGEGLRELVERAGGLTADAYPEGVRFFRRYREVGDTARRLTRVNVDLVDILEDRDRRDVSLADGDSIHVPEYISTVRVEGAVLYPTTVLYERGAGLGYYIERAGGYARDADSGRTWVEYPDGSVATVSKFLIFKSGPTPEPGSRVFVPAKPDEPGGGLDARAVAALLSSVATIIAIATR